MRAPRWRPAWCAFVLQRPSANLRRAAPALHCLWRGGRWLACWTLAFPALWGCGWGVGLLLCDGASCVLAVYSPGLTCVGLGASVATPAPCGGVGVDVDRGVLARSLALCSLCFGEVVFVAGRARPRQRHRRLLRRRSFPRRRLFLHLCTLGIPGLPPSVERGPRRCGGGSSACVGGFLSVHTCHLSLVCSRSRHPVRGPNGRVGCPHDLGRGIYKMYSSTSTRD